MNLGIECVRSDYMDFMLRCNDVIRKDVMNDKGELFDIKTIFAIDLDGILDSSRSLEHYIGMYRDAIRDGYLPVALTEDNYIVFIGMKSK